MKKSKKQTGKKSKLGFGNEAPTKKSSTKKSSTKKQKDTTGRHTPFY